MNSLTTGHVDIGELRIGYRRQGDGQCLLLLHGGVCDSRVWRRQLELLSDDYCVIAWDAPGCGASSDPRPTFTMSDFAGSLSRFVDALGIQPAHIIGHSWGSTLALELYRQRPDAVRSLVLVGAYAGWAGSLPHDEVERRLELAIRESRDAAMGTAPQSMSIVSDTMATHQYEELRAIMSDARPATTTIMAYAMAQADLRDTLASIDVATLLVYGDADERAPLAVARELHSSIAQSELVTVRGVGHDCFIEAPDTFAAVVRAFVNAV